MDILSEIMTVHPGDVLQSAAPVLPKFMAQLLKDTVIVPVVVQFFEMLFDVDDRVHQAFDVIVTSNFLANLCFGNVFRLGLHPFRENYGIPS
jgi:hypothetical protein